MDAKTNIWKEYLLQWPAKLPRTGLIISHFGEQIPFVGFMTHDNFLLLQRRAPDSLGARIVILPYDQVAALKLTEVISQHVFTAGGFEGTLAKL